MVGFIVCCYCFVIGGGFWGCFFLFFFGGVLLLIFIDIRMAAQVAYPMSTFGREEA